MTDSEDKACYRRGAVYFDDGDIVLSVKGDKKQNVLYRVDIKFLSRHSPVFAGMFSLPFSPGVNEEHEGVPVVHLDDDPMALEGLLQFIYNPVSLGLKKRSSDTALRCMGLLKLAKKYEIDTVKGFVAQHIRNDWPNTLDEWRCQQAEIAKLEEVYCNACNAAHGVKGPYLSDLFPEPASVIQLCLTYDIPEPLPAAFYQLSLTKFGDDYDRWKKDKEKGAWKYRQVRVSGVSTASPLVYWRRTARWSLLDGDTFMRLLVGREALQECQAQLGPPAGAPAGCKKGKGTSFCADQLKLVLAQKYVSKHGESLGFFEHFAQVAEALESCDSLCEPCRRAHSAALERAMSTTWNSLPGFFSLKKLD